MDKPNEETKPIMQAASEFMHGLGANGRARFAANRRNTRPPRQTRREKEWLQRYRHRLLERGLPLEMVIEIDPEVSLDYDPADAADDELDYMADDHRLIHGERA